MVLPSRKTNENEENKVKEPRLGSLTLFLEDVIIFQRIYDILQPSPAGLPTARIELCLLVDGSYMDTGQGICVKDATTVIDHEISVQLVVFLILMLLISNQ